jgi:hypothetical protein
LGRSWAAWIEGWVLPPVLKISLPALDDGVDGLRFLGLERADGGGEFARRQGSAQACEAYREFAATVAQFAGKGRGAI